MQACHKDLSKHASFLLHSASLQDSACNPQVQVCMYPENMQIFKSTCKVPESENLRFSRNLFYKIPVNYRRIFFLILTATLCMLADFLEFTLTRKFLPTWSDIDAPCSACIPRCRLPQSVRTQWECVDGRRACWCCRPSAFPDACVTQRPLQHVRKFHYPRAESRHDGR